MLCRTVCCFLVRSRHPLKSESGQTHLACAALNASGDRGSVGLAKSSRHTKVHSKRFTKAAEEELPYPGISQKIKGSGSVCLHAFDSSSVDDLVVRIPERDRWQIVRQNLLYLDVICSARTLVLLT